jgi:uncharacterized membrane protein
MSTPQSSGRTSIGVAPNLAGLLAYLPSVCCGAGLVVSLALFIMEKQNRTVRFHAMQALLINAGVGALSLVFWLLSLVLSQIANVLGFLATLMLLVLLLAITGLQILLMIKAYQGEEVELPVIGEIARKQV